MLSAPTGDQVTGRDLDAMTARRLQHAGHVFRRDGARCAPILDYRWSAADLLGGLPDGAEAGQNLCDLSHGRSMYKSPVRIATVDLDIRCPKNLQIGRMPNAAESLKALREALPGSPGVREIARELGYEMPNAYGYYESKQFKKAHLPLDKAREFAEVFERLGGDASAVLALAGLTVKEQDREALQIRGPSPPFQLVPFNIAFPSEDALTEALSGLLDGVGIDPEQDERARKLARLLPNALQLAATHPTDPRALRAKVRESTAPGRGATRQHS